MTFSPLDNSGERRNKRAFAVGSLVFGLIYLGFLAAPVVGLVTAWLQGDSQVSLEKFLAIFASERVVRLVSKSFCIAIATATISTGVGWTVDGLLRKVGEPLAQIWVALFTAGFLLSPYIYVQGWIGWIGSHGLLWKSLNLSAAPFSIYSTPGVIAMLVMSNLPLAVAFVYLSRRVFPAKVDEAAVLFQMPFGQRLRLVELPAVGRGLVASFLWIFVFSFWAYDIPSMLRQNMFSLEILAAFGSFYDYGRGMLLAALPVFVIVLLGCTSVFWYGSPSVNARRFVQPRRVAVWPNLLLIAIPLCLWGMPMAGLVAQITSLRHFVETVTAARIDIMNSARNGIIAAGSAVVLCFLLSFFARGLSSAASFRRWFLLPLPWIATPGIVIGMGYVYLFNLPIAGVVTKNNLQLLVIELAVALPIVGTLMLVQMSAWPDEWTKAGGMFQLGPLRQLTCIATPWLRTGLFAAFAVGFAFAIREVPASLLNYPPGGATVAITIETMLHFDQPEKVASLCVVQMLMLFAGCAPLLAGIELTKYVRYQLQRRG